MSFYEEYEKIRGEFRILDIEDGGWSKDAESAVKKAALEVEYEIHMYADPELTEGGKNAEISGKVEELGGQWWHSVTKGGGRLFCLRADYEQHIRFVVKNYKGEF